MLIDAHVHLSMDGVNYKAHRASPPQQMDAFIRRTLRQYKQAGVIALRDGGDPLGISLRARELAQEEEIIFKTPGFALYKEGCYGALIGRGYRDFSELKALLKELFAQNPDHIKVALSGLVSFNRFGVVGAGGIIKAELDYIVKSAHDRGLPVMVHSSGSITDLAIEAGVDTLEHGYLLEKDQLRALKEQNITWFPTFAPLRAMLKLGAPLCDQEVLKRLLRRQKEDLLFALSQGVLAGHGSDAGAQGLPHGQGLKEELQAFEEAGLSPEENRRLNRIAGCKALGLPAARVQ
jgi:imidazolonepropionase-like amidohydrolase